MKKVTSIRIEEDALLALKAKHTNVNGLIESLILAWLNDQKGEKEVIIRNLTEKKASLALIQAQISVLEKQLSDIERHEHEARKSIEREKLRKKVEEERKWEGING